jgi:hypothetical protein
MSKLQGKKELRRSRKQAAQKVELSPLLREETMMTLAWIAQHLSMGSRAYIPHLAGVIPRYLHFLPLLSAGVRRNHDTRKGHWTKSKRKSSGGLSP